MIDNHYHQITPRILYNRPHNYDWLIKACLVYQQEEGKKGHEQTNQQTIIEINKWSANSFVYIFLSVKTPCLILKTYRAKPRFFQILADIHIQLNTKKLSRLIIYLTIAVLQIEKNPANGDLVSDVKKSFFVKPS